MAEKVIENKKQKRQNLLEAAFYLLTQKDIQEVSVADLTKQAGIAKGTFYLYFKDKYQLRDFLVSLQSAKILMRAQEELDKNDIRSFEDAIIFMVNQVLIQLESNPILLKFIQRNLSWGVFHEQLSNTSEIDSLHLRESFAQRARQAGYEYDKPDVVFAMILELTGSICYTSITKNSPLPIRQLKPYLFNSIRGILQQGNRKGMSEPENQMQGTDRL